MEPGGKKCLARAALESGRESSIVVEWQHDRTKTKAGYLIIGSADIRCDKKPASAINDTARMTYCIVRSARLGASRPRA